MRDNHPGNSLVRGNHVIVTQKKGNKPMPAFRPLTVTDFKCAMITASDGDYCILQNASQFRKVVDNVETIEDKYWNDEEGGKVADSCQTSEPSRTKGEIQGVKVSKSPSDEHFNLE